VTGWLTVPLHGINEAWIAVGALVIFLITGVLDKKSLKNHIDWGFLLFFGVIYSIADICLRFKIDDFMMGIIAPILSSFSYHPMVFLMVVTVIVYLVRLFLKKDSAVILLMLGLLPWAQGLGIHPGVLLVTVLLASEGWLLPYQDNSYQIAYYSVDGKAFSHTQARKLMIARFLSCFLIIAISVPYWKLLGFIR
jgi:di/tricarboxylate transporter